MVGIMKHASDASLEVKNYVNSKKLEEEGRDLGTKIICSIVYFTHKKLIHS